MVDNQNVGVAHFLRADFYVTGFSDLGVDLLAAGHLGQSLFAAQQY